MPDAKYGEPWERAGGNGLRLYDTKQRSRGIGDSGEDCDRIVACVNAMSGIDDPTAAAEVLRLAEKWIQVMDDENAGFAETKRVVNEFEAAARKMKEQP